MNYCEFCGKKLVFVRKYTTSKFNGETGVKETKHFELWKCPDANVYLMSEFEDPHTVHVREVDGE